MARSTTEGLKMRHGSEFPENLASLEYLAVRPFSGNPLAPTRRIGRPGYGQTPPSVGSNAGASPHIFRRYCWGTTLENTNGNCKQAVAPCDNKPPQVLLRPLRQTQMFLRISF